MVDKNKTGSSMSTELTHTIQRVSVSNEPIEFDENACSGCNMCLEACMMDVYGPNPIKGKPPIVLHPDECWYCGNCVRACQLREKGAIEIKWPIKWRLRWKRKETGEHFCVGMPNPLSPNTTPPVGGWDPKA